MQGTFVCTLVGVLIKHMAYLLSKMMPARRICLIQTHSYFFRRFRRSRRGRQISWLPRMFGRKSWLPRPKKRNRSNKPIIVQTSHTTSAGTGFLIALSVVLMSPFAYLSYITYNSRNVMYDELIEPEQMPIHELTPWLEQYKHELQV